MSSTRFAPRRLPGAEAVPQSEAGRSGGPDGNEQLTAVTGVVLIVLLAALGVTILFIGQLTWLHLFLGFVLIGPVGLKMASTGWRFMRYYTHNPVYVRRGPPVMWLRLLAPGVVATTVAVWATGVVLMFLGPAHRDPWVLLHKASFIAWIAVTALHVLGHLLDLPAALRADALRDTGRGGGQAGAAGRVIAIAGAIVAGLVLAIVLIPDFSSWTAQGALLSGGDH
ncbi:MAG TPA: hypothetical protein VFN55_05530 [Solirubrobacteraceae bacterium]|nr:hypothetical protein [Solirubrobacteraceae bacterium]